MTNNGLEIKIPEKPSQELLAIFKFIYTIGKCAAHANSAAIAYLDSVKSCSNKNENAFEPNRYQAIIDISNIIYRLLVSKPLEINKLNDALDKVHSVIRKSMTDWTFWLVIEPNTNLELNLMYTTELVQPAAFLIKTLFEQNKLKEADIAPIIPNNHGEFCELAITLFSKHILPDIRPELKKNAGDTTLADVIKIFEQKYLNKPVIKPVGQESELTDLLNNILEKCWARINEPDFAGRIAYMDTYYEKSNLIYASCHADGVRHSFFGLSYTSYKGVYKSFKINSYWNNPWEVYYKNGNNIKMDDTTIEGILYAHFKLTPKPGTN